MNKEVGSFGPAGRLVLKGLLYFLEVFPADDCLVGVVNVVLVALPMVPHGFVGERVRNVFLLKETVANVSLVGKNVTHPVNCPRLPISRVDTLAV